MNFLGDNNFKILPLSIPNINDPFHQVMKNKTVQKVFISNCIFSSCYKSQHGIYCIVSLSIIVSVVDFVARISVIE